VPMPDFSPGGPEASAIWQAVMAAGRKSVTSISAEDHEGADSVALALAAHAGSSGSGPALLVDLHLSQPGRFAAALGLKHAPGQILHLSPSISFIQPQLPADGTILDPAPLIAGFEEDTTWSFVAVAGAPVLSREVEPVSGIAAASATRIAIMVVLSAKTGSGRVLEAQTKLQRAGVTIAGAVLNDRCNPTLGEELANLVPVADRIFPRIMDAIRARIRSSEFLCRAR
jgi:hypothetical protein